MYYTIVGRLALSAIDCYPQTHRRSQWISWAVPQLTHRRSQWTHRRSQWISWGVPQSKDGIYLKKSSILSFKKVIRKVLKEQASSDQKFWQCLFLDTINL